MFYVFLIIFHFSSCFFWSVKSIIIIITIVFCIVCILQLSVSYLMVNYFYLFSITVQLWIDCAKKLRGDTRLYTKSEMKEERKKNNQNKQTRNEDDSTPPRRWHCWTSSWCRLLHISCHQERIPVMCPFVISLSRSCWVGVCRQLTTPIWVDAIWKASINWL